MARIPGFSKSLGHKLHHRWLTEGDAAFTPRSTAPRSRHDRTLTTVRDRILKLRTRRAADGLEAGADTICSLLTAEQVTISRSTI